MSLVTCHSINSRERESEKLLSIPRYNISKDISELFLY